MASLAASLASLRVDQRRLAKRTGLSRTRVAEIFAGSSPNGRELRLIAEYLRIPADSLVKSETRPRSDVRFRKTPRKNPPLATEARTQEIASFLSENNLVSRSAAPSPRFSADLQDRPSIERAADSIRQLICANGEHLDPLPDLAARIDRAGLASSIVLHDLGIEGASTNINGKGLIVIAARTFSPRMLFTCAHELAHVVLGHTESGNWLMDEDTIEAFDADHEEERLCNALASALLQPAEGVARFLQTVRRQFQIPQGALTATEALLVARYYGTSFFASVMRLEYLEIAPAGTAASFEHAIKANHKSPESYAEQMGLPPRVRVDMPAISPVLGKSIAIAVEEGDISVGRVADVLGYSVIEISDALTRSDH